MRRLHWEVLDSAYREFWSDSFLLSYECWFRNFQKQNGNKCPLRFLSYLRIFILSENHQKVLNVYFLIIFCCNVYYVTCQEQVYTTFQIHNISFEDPFIVGSWCAKYFLVLHDMIMYIFQTFKDNFHFRCSISWFLFSPYHFVLKLMEFAKTASFESNTDFAYLRILCKCWKVITLVINYVS